MVDVKFCGLTRPQDASFAAELGAVYAGVIFAGGPRRLTPERAAEVLEPLRGTPVRKVGVFGALEVTEIATIADAASVDVVQLHGGATAEIISELRRRFGGAIWVVTRVARDESMTGGAGVVGSDAVVFDAAVPGQLGGSGVTIDWTAQSFMDEVRRVRKIAGGTLVLAGGLNAENVGRAVRLVRPDVVDVSSGVESALGIKDHDRMRAFFLAARASIEEER